MGMGVAQHDHDNDHNYSQEGSLYSIDTIIFGKQRGTVSACPAVLIHIYLSSFNLMKIFLVKKFQLNEHQNFTTFNTLNLRVVLLSKSGIKIKSNVFETSDVIL